MHLSVRAWRMQLSPLTRSNRLRESPTGHIFSIFSWTDRFPHLASACTMQFAVHHPTHMGHTLIEARHSRFNQSRRENKTISTVGCRFLGIRGIERALYRKLDSIIRIAKRWPILCSASRADALWKCIFYMRENKHRRGKGRASAGHVQPPRAFCEPSKGHQLDDNYATDGNSRCPVNEIKLHSSGRYSSRHETGF